MSALLLACVAGHPAIVRAQGEGDEALAIVGGFLIDGNEGKPIDDAVILVEGGRIAHVGTVSDTRVPDGAEVIDAAGYTVLPGLHDVHVHTMLIGHGVQGGYHRRYEDRLREVMAISARQLLMAGVTSARDVGGPLDEVLWLREEVASGRLPGPRLFVSGPRLQKTTEGPDDRRNWSVDGAEDARAKARRLIDAGVDLIKVTQISLMSPEEREAIASEARRAGVHLAGHAYSLEEHRLAAEMGLKTIEHLVTRSGPLYLDESLRVISSNSIAVTATNVVMRVYEITLEYPERLDDRQLEEDLPPDLYRDLRGSLTHPARLDFFDRAKESFTEANWAAKTRQLHGHGIRILVGTDSGTPLNFHYESTWQEMDLLVRYGIPPMRVISAATRFPAELYGLGSELGTVEPGKWADLIVVDGNPLRDMSALRRRNVVHVIKGGVQYR